MKLFTFLLLIIPSFFIYSQSPEFEWVGQLGGINEKNGFAETGRDIITDIKGNVYVIGNFHDSIDFDPGEETVSLTSNGASDIFVGKYSSAGELIWVISIGGEGIERATSVTLDASNNLYITGMFDGTVDFDPGSEVYQLSGNMDCYILKLDKNGSFIWAKSISGDGTGEGTSIQVDQNNNIYTTGVYHGTFDFDPGTAVYALTDNGASDFYVLKLNQNGDFIWAKSIGGPETERSGSLALDNDLNIYVTGFFNNIVDFDPSDEEFNLTEVGYKNGDQFILKLDVDGAFVWAKGIGGNKFTLGKKIIIDNELDFIYTTGAFDSGIVDFDPGPDTSYLNATGYIDLFISKYDLNGNYIWAKAIGGELQSVSGDDIALDKEHNVYLCGQFSQTVDFDPGEEIHILSSPINHDAFILKLDQDGKYNWAGSFSGSNYEVCLAINIDESDNIYTTGYFQTEIDFDPSDEIYEITAFGTEAQTDAFIHKMCQTCDVTSIEMAHKINSLEYKVYPNPCHEFLIFNSLDNESYELILFDVMGSEMYRAGEVTGPIQIPINNIPQGLYWLKIYNQEKGTYWKQIQVQKY